MKYSLHIPKHFLCLFLIASCLGQRSYKGDKINYKYELFPETPKLLDIYISEDDKSYSLVMEFSAANFDYVKNETFAPPSVNLMLKNVKWKKAMENARAYISTGASAHWDMLVFEHNIHQVNLVKQLAKKMGFTWFRVKATDRWDTYNTDLGLNPVNSYTKPDYNNVSIICERDADTSIFLDYTGKFWPCCHMAEAYLNKIGYELHKDLRQYNNEELFNVYSPKLANSTPFYICKRACNTTHNKKHQFKSEEQLK